MRQLDSDEFTQLLKLFGGNLRCSDPCDPLYALLSLLSENGRAQLSIEPDYSKSTFDLLKDVIKSFKRVPPSEDLAELMEAVHSVRRALKLSDHDPAVEQLLLDTHLHFTKSTIECVCKHCPESKLRE